MCRDIRDAKTIIARELQLSITFIRDNATAQDSAGESITFQRSAGTSTLEKVKVSPGVEPPTLARQCHCIYSGLRNI